MKSLVAIFFILQLSFINIYPQTKEKQGAQAVIGCGFASRDIWRGVELSSGPVIQPELSVIFDNFEAGIIGSYEFIPNDSETSTECDLYFKYNSLIEYGKLSFAVMDYYFPARNISFTNFKGGEQGAHTLEFSVSFEGKEVFPLNCFVSINFYNDTQKSTYLELGYNFKINEAEIYLFSGGAGGPSKWYEIDSNKPEIINLGVNASKEFFVTD